MLQDMGLQRVLHDCETEQQQKVWDTIKGPENLNRVNNAIRISTDAGRDWGQEEKGTTEDEMAGWHHWLDGHESGWTPGAGDGQGGLACWDSWGRKESDMTEQLN